MPDVKQYGDGRIVPTWDIAPPRDLPMLMVCSYGGTRTYLRALIPDTMTNCKLTVTSARRLGLCH